MKSCYFGVFCVVLCFLGFPVSGKKAADEETFKCPDSGTIFNTTLAAYYPDFQSGMDSDTQDIRGKKLRTLQDFLDGRSEFVTAAMDIELNIEYGTMLCLPELNHHFGKFIPIQVRDSSAELVGSGFARVDICVRTETDSYDNIVNRELTLAVLQE